MKILLSGAALSLAAGLALGGAMQPHLDDGDDRPAGPQMFADWAGARSTGPFDPGTTFASYSGKIPDYVMGTDWKRRMTWPDEPAATSSRGQAADADPQSDTAILSRADYDGPEPAAHDYPSMLGPHPSVIDVSSDDDPTPDPATGA